MRKREITILLLGLICFGSARGFVKVICHGPDGHVSLETFFHNHCHCIEPDQTGGYNIFLETTASLSIEHNHCKDTLATGDFYILGLKNFKISSLKVFASQPQLKSIPYDTGSSAGFMIAEISSLHSFFTPLRTVILLA